MLNSILVDTDVLIDFLRGYDQAVTFIDEFSPHIILSPIVVAELYAGVKGTRELNVLNNFKYKNGYGYYYKYYYSYESERSKRQRRSSREREKEKKK